MAAEQNLAADQISELPELVLHRILSFLPAKDAARTSLLSKRWKNMWDTLPYLNFGKGFLNPVILTGENFGAGKVSLNPLFANRQNRHDSKQLKKTRFLLKIADRIILNRSQNVSIEKLCLTIPQHKLSKKQMLTQPEHPVSFKLERLMSCVARPSLRELDLTNHVKRHHYLPSSILLAKSLNVLSLSGFSLMSLSSRDIKFSSLRKLFLNKVYLSDCIMNSLMVGCPLLENLELKCCHGLETVNVTGLPKLKTLKVLSVFHLKILQVDAPELQVLSVFGPSAECKFNMKTCACLRELVFWGRFITDEWLNQFISECLFLKKLDIGASNRLVNIKISSDTLKTLNLSVLENLDEVEITAPALENFNFQAKSLPVFLLSASDMLEVELDFFPQNVDVGYQEFTKFLGYFNHFRTVTIRGLLNRVIIPKDNRDNLLSPLWGAGNLVFSLCLKDFVTTELLEYLLWLAPRPESVSITWRNYRFPVEGFEDITCASLKFIYDQKDASVDLSCPCCEFLPFDCWRHCLAEVRVKNFEVDADQMTRMKNVFIEHVADLKIVESSPGAGWFWGEFWATYDELFL